MRAKWEKRDCHKSSFTFKSFTRPEEDLQKDKIYCCRSTQIQEGMSDQPAAIKTQTKFYHDNLFQSSTRKYQVPVELAPNNPRQYEHFYLAHRKFTKPYGTLTKFSDSLNRNRSLLRRAQHETPLPPPLPPQKPFEHVNRPHVRGRSIKAKQENLSLSMGFHMTLGEHAGVIREVMVHGEGKVMVHGDGKVMGYGEGKVSQSLNRLLAAQMIQDQVRPRVFGRSRTEHK